MFYARAKSSCVRLSCSFLQGLTIFYSFFWRTSISNCVSIAVLLFKVQIIQNGIAYMFFRASALIEQIEGLSSMRLEVVGRANVNEWGGQYTPQIFVDDYNVYDNRLIF